MNILKKLLNLKREKEFLWIVEKVWFLASVRKIEMKAALVSWTLSTDGRYFEDEDGFGGTDDEEGWQCK